MKSSYCYTHSGGNVLSVAHFAGYQDLWWADGQMVGAQREGCEW